MRESEFCTSMCERGRLCEDLHTLSCSLYSALTIERAGQIAQWGSNSVTPSSPLFPPPPFLSLLMSPRLSVWSSAGGCRVTLGRSWERRVSKSLIQRDFCSFSEGFKNPISHLLFWATGVGDGHSVAGPGVGLAGCSPGGWTGITNPWGSWWVLVVPLVFKVVVLWLTYNGAEKSDKQMF